MHHIETRIDRNKHWLLGNKHEYGALLPTYIHTPPHWARFERFSSSECTRWRAPRACTGTLCGLGWPFVAPAWFWAVGHNSCIFEVIWERWAQAYPHRRCTCGSGYWGRLPTLQMGSFHRKTAQKPPPHFEGGSGTCPCLPHGRSLGFHSRV